MRRPATAPTARLLTAATLAAALVGCGGPPPPAPPPDAPPGYVQLRETFGPLDFAPLAARRIVLDPGHGGFFRGALGPNGLAEADVNLGVALHLRGLLEWAGAEVSMTRTADYDFLSPADSSLVTDLAFRVSFSEEKQPDVFLSIHHNSTATADPQINETQTYYPLGDDGASLDLAQAIHRHLVLNLEISPAQILPGNFHVLRHATVPAVLGEPAMISHPVMAGRLSLAASQRLEAEAYFLGLLDYFAGGDPRWHADHGDTVVVADADTTLAWTFGDGRDGAPGPDPATYSLRLDGRQVDADLDATGETVRWAVPHSLDGGPHRVTLTGRNLAGRRTPVHVTVLAAAAARTVTITALSEAEGVAQRRSHLLCTTPDGRPLPPGVAGWPGAVPGDFIVIPAGTPSRTGLVRRGEGEPVFHGSGIDVVVEFREEVLPAGFRLWGVAGGGTWRDRLDGGSGATARRLAGAVVHRPATPAWLEAPGWIPMVPETADTGAGVVDLASTPLTPQLAGRTVVIDPEGGGPDSDGSGPLGLRGADLNREVALRLARLLEGCGARAVLTRDAGAAPSAVARVALADEVGADFFLTIGRAADPALVTVRHHPGSVDGAAWADRAAVAVGRLLPGTTVAVEESWAYRLRHTSCPALEIRLPGPVNAVAELRQQSTGWQAAEARALLLGILGLLEADPPLPVVDPLALLADWPGAPDTVAVTRAVWDGNLPLYPLPTTDGNVAGDSVSSWCEPGVPARGTLHTLEVHTPDRWQLWLVAADSEGGWTGRLAYAGTKTARTDE